MRIVLMGTGEFALPAFRAVLGSVHKVVAVVTQPDKVGRGHHQHVNVVKALGESGGLPVLQPEVVQRLMLQLCDGLAYAHGQGVVHRSAEPDPAAESGFVRGCAGR